MIIIFINKQKDRLDQHRRSFLIAAPITVGRKASSKDIQCILELQPLLLSEEGLLSIKEIFVDDTKIEANNSKNHGACRTNNAAQQISAHHVGLIPIL
jgi:hypothetical protein